MKTAVSYAIANVTTNNQGTFRVAVSNEFGGVLSSNAVLTVSNPPTVSVAYLRSLLDPVNFLAPDGSDPLSGHRHRHDLYQPDDRQHLVLLSPGRHRGH